MILQIIQKTRFEKRELHLLLLRRFSIPSSKSPDRICVVDGTKTIVEVELEVFSIIKRLCRFDVGLYP